jgi:hypothetical protein
MVARVASTDVNSQCSIVVGAPSVSVRSIDDAALRSAHPQPLDRE